MGRDRDQDLPWTGLPGRVRRTSRVCAGLGRARTPFAVLDSLLAVPSDALELFYEAARTWGTTTTQL